MPLSDIPSAPELFPPALVKFVLAPDPFLRADFPRDLQPAEVAAFVEARVDPTFPPVAWEQLFLVVDHYDVHEASSRLLKLAEPPKPPPAAQNERAKLPPVVPVAGRISMIKTVAVAGKPADRARADELYRALCRETSPEDLETVRRLVEADETALAALDAAPLVERLSATVNSLAKFETSVDPVDADKRQLHGELEALARRLARSDKAAASQRALLAIPDRPQRLRQIVRAYLALPMDFPGNLVEWAGRQLRRETWSPQPSGQLERTFVPALRAELVAAFRAALAEIDAGAESDEVKIKQRVTALDAIQFFNGKLSAEESKFLVSAGKGYVLALSLRQIHPSH